MPEEVQDKPENKQGMEEFLSRRQFLQAMGLLAAGSVLAACAEAQQGTGINTRDFDTPIPGQVLQSPQPPDPQPTVVTPALASFLAISSLLTGFENLDPRVGQIYMESIQQDPEAPLTLEALFEQAQVGPDQAPGTLEELEATGIFEQEETSSLAEQIMTMWYTGVYTQEGEPHVATFVDALAWKSLRYTKPASICGSPGFWATHPDADVSPPTENLPEEPTPTPEA